MSPEVYKQWRAPASDMQSFDQYYVLLLCRRGGGVRSGGYAEDMIHAGAYGDPTKQRARGDSRGTALGMLGGEAGASSESAMWVWSS